ncbi:hypothetical protein J2T16_000991 [Paenibacillus intestini]|nr:hypothetical protein [Paenibacillus intestini]
MLKESLLEIAKLDVREAMRKEIELNELIIEEYKNLNRYSKRHLKEIALRAIARNDSLKAFLSLATEEQKPDELGNVYPHNALFDQYVRQTSSSSYAASIGREARLQLNRDYTHGHMYSKRKYKSWFLDEPIPETTVTFLDKVGFFFDGFWNFIKERENFSTIYGFIIIASFIWLIFFSDGKETITATNSNTISSGGVFGGNSSSKSVPDSPQVKDSSGQAGFGNSGQSGFDAVSSNVENSSSASTQNENDEPKIQQSTHIFELKAEYYLPRRGSNDVFSIKDGETVEDLVEGDELVLTIYKPNGEFIYGFWNGELLEGQNHNWNDDKVSYTFWLKAGINEIIVVNGTEEYLFNFNTTEFVNTFDPFQYFTIGSSKEEVLSLMGEKGKGREITIGNEVWWFYDDKLSYICFDSKGEVKAWRNHNHFLKVTLGYKEPNAPDLTIGSSKEDVIKAMGTPSAILYDNSWQYGANTINFNNNDKVVSFIDIDGSLKTE